MWVLSNFLKFLKDIYYHYFKTFNHPLLTTYFLMFTSFYHMRAVLYCCKSNTDNILKLCASCPDVYKRHNSILLIKDTYFLSFACFIKIFVGKTFWLKMYLFPVLFKRKIKRCLTFFEVCSESGDSGSSLWSMIISLIINSPIIRNVGRQN